MFWHKGLWSAKPRMRAAADDANTTVELVRGKIGWDCESGGRQWPPRSPSEKRTAKLDGVRRHLACQCVGVPDRRRICAGHERQTRGIDRRRASLTAPPVSSKWFGVSLA